MKCLRPGQDMPPLPDSLCSCHVIPAPTPLPAWHLQVYWPRLGSAPSSADRLLLLRLAPAVLTFTASTPLARHPLPLTASPPVCRSSGDDLAARRVLTELLLQLTAVGNRAGALVWVLAATNRLQECDPALLRRWVGGRQVQFAGGRQQFAGCRWVLLSFWLHACALQAVKPVEETSYPPLPLLLLCSAGLTGK